jgi:hypothetical protein
MHYEVTVKIVVGSSFSIQEVSNEVEEVLRHAFFDVKVNEIVTRTISKETFEATREIDSDEPPS